MKTIKIRFVENISNTSPSIYHIQHKRWYGWRYSYHRMGTNGYGTILSQYYNQNRDKLLEDVLTNHFKICKKFVKIIKYTSLKIY